jgi:nucleoside-diphosphate-sugar epimerase
VIRTEAELDEILSRPSPADIDAVRALDGDLLILGVAGKMGPSLAMRAQRAVQEAGIAKRVYGVARYSRPHVAEQLRDSGIAVIGADLLEPSALDRLPDAPNVLYMAAMKFGTTGAEHLTWALNVHLPGLVAQRYRHSRIVAFSSGNVYPLVPLTSGGATEDTAPGPLGEYAQSVLGRERMFAYASHQYGTPVTLLRLNYAAELRYGVLLDIGTKVFEGRPIDLGMGMVNVIWQGDANSQALRCFPLCQTPPRVLNITGPETLSVRWIAGEFGRLFGIEPVFEGAESATALLSNSARASSMFGYPAVTPAQMINWIAGWIGASGATLGKPTHFETRDGRF